MHQLFLLRHAKAVRGSAELSDHDRPLAPEGRRAAAAIGAAMRGFGLTPDVIFVSSARRTQETLEALQPWEDWPNIETLPGLYMASHMQIRELLRELPETMRSVLVIGHNPGIHELAQWLAGAPSASAPPPSKDVARLAEEYPTGALCEFSITSLWRKTGPAGAILQRLIRPADLPAAPR